MRVISSIKEEVLRRLRTRGSVTVELVSCRNVRAARACEEGDEIFITHEYYEDLARGTIGIVARIVQKDIGESRVSANHFGDEKEITRARLRLEFSAIGEIEEINGGEIPQATIRRSEHIIIG
ncbi:MAG: DUF473 domain-containing protein [Candidatus Diapherotrites archaeon]|nr:DUF473 domain-containing protein [Candidatus Diapherotrites archaeon]